MKMQSKLDSYDKEFEEKIGRIIKLELEMVSAISEGYKTADNDKFKNHREELRKLRGELNLIKT
jgi:hypothetical protein